MLTYITPENEDLDMALDHVANSFENLMASLSSPDYVTFQNARIAAMAVRYVN